MLTEVIGFFIIPAALGARRGTDFFHKKGRKCLGERHAKQRQDVAEYKKMSACSAEIQVLKVTAPRGICLHL